jgi:radical SAM protein with 4Fe4S-binding SPASM domain
VLPGAGGRHHTCRIARATGGGRPTEEEATRAPGSVGSDPRFAKIRAMAERTLEVFLDTTNMCNLKCVTCVFSDPRVAKLPKYVMPWELYEKVATQVFPRAEYLTLSCLSEPLMNREFARYLRRAGELEVPRMEFVTNAQLLREEHLQACVDARLWRIAVSLDGGDAVSYETVRRGASWDKLLSNMDHALEFFAGAPYRPVLRVIVTLVQDNFRGAAEAVRLALRWGAGEVELRETIAFPEIGLEARQLKHHGAELRSVLLECKATCEAAGVPVVILSENAPGLKVDLSGLPPCAALEKRVAIAANGDVMPCMLWARQPLGNLGEASFEQIWNGPRRLQLREQFRTEQPLFWCLTCTICKDTPTDDDAYFRLLAKPRPIGPFAEPVPVEG